jgi:hypothetical protein
MIPPSASQPARKHIAYPIANSIVIPSRANTRIMLYNSFRSMANDHK